MTKDIIQMAKEAGFESSEYGLAGVPGMYAYNMEIIKRFANLVAAAEREACALLAQQFHIHGYDMTGDMELHEVIRARSQS